MSDPSKHRSDRSSSDKAHPEKTQGKKAYSSPDIRRWGTLTEITGTGFTTAGGDAKGGSVMSDGG